VPKVLVVDVGGTNIKMLATGQTRAAQNSFRPAMTRGKMVRVVKECMKDWKFDRVRWVIRGPIINGTRFASLITWEAGG